MKVYCPIQNCKWETTFSTEGLDNHAIYAKAKAEIKGTIVHVLNLTLHTKACKIILFTKEIIPKTTSNFPTVPLYPPIITES